MGLAVPSQWNFSIFLRRLRVHCFLKLVLEADADGSWIYYLLKLVSL